MRFTTCFVAGAVALGSFASASVGASGAELGHGSFLRPRHGSGSAHVLSKRATSSTTSTLSTIIEMIIPKCKSTCSSMITDLSSCAGQSSETAIATCACSSTALGDIRTCAACIAEDTTSTKNATAVVNDYNSFVKLCIADGLATVTGTVAVGASTSAVKRTSTTKAAAAASTTKASSSHSASAAAASSHSASAASASSASASVKAAAAAVSSSAASSSTPTAASATGQVGAKAAAVTVSSTSTVSPSATAGSTTSPADKMVASWAVGLVGAGAAAWFALV